MRHCKLLLVLALTVLTLNPALAALTMTVTSDMVFSGETATLTCSVTADNSEILTVKQWKDQSGDVIGGGPGEFEKNGVQYTITDLGVTSDQIVHWELVSASVTSDNELTCFVLTSVGPPKIDSGRVEVVGLTPVNSVTTSGDSSSVSCILTGLSGSDVQVEWSQNGSPLSRGSHVESKDFTEPDKVAVLTVPDITSDQTYTCTFTGEAGGSVSSTVKIDHVTITASGAGGVAPGDRVTLSCVLDGADSAPLETNWFRSDGSAILTGLENGFSPYTSAIFKEGSQTDILIIESVKKSENFTCCFVFKEGDCVEGVAELDVIVVEDEEGEGEEGEGDVGGSGDGLDNDIGDGLGDNTGSGSGDDIDEGAGDGTDEGAGDGTDEDAGDGTDEGAGDGTDEGAGDGIDEGDDDKDEDSSSGDNKTDGGTDGDDIDNGAFSYWGEKLSPSLMNIRI